MWISYSVAVKLVDTFPEETLSSGNRNVRRWLPQSS